MKDYGPGPWWWACTRPEAPADLWVCWDHGCDSCCLAMEAGLRAGLVAQAAYDEMVRWREERGRPWPGRVANPTRVG